MKQNQNEPMETTVFRFLTLFKVGYSDSNCVCVCLLTDCSPPFEVRVYTNAVPDNAIATIANTAYSRGKQALGPILQKLFTP